MSDPISYTELKMTEQGKEGRFSFRPLDANKDVELLYSWMHQKHIAPFWKLDVPKPELESWVHRSVNAEHKDCYIGTYNGETVCYLIAYNIEKDPIKEYYHYQPGDLGMHLLIGPRSTLNKENGLSLIRAMIFFLFDRYGAKRIIGEPDRRNRVIIPILKQVGGSILGRIHLPNKEASLIVGEKGLFERSLQDQDVEIEVVNRMVTPEGRYV
ncbi:Protein N-acetyltransferase, RimJ/RimL family [Halobacillus karajensis]|uniref:Lysine N-acyltransferase MbtK n=1 Tax=Halobacillus karajensis TaxID=195088 RepID=A0A024P827_9BACI|nr:GNAT family N-acetyltransferase [Halobacillus karajensis]CDQ18161.1 Lysine N-acyltransferase MbtK [Halobacillus karajensis]CDQ24512.1 Lysine N-acyltransferase MbtK [Halobacillus karajensis]CDQ29240.1 Lysine N-acyltransferase MbtK [Halobacillus karajensis]SEH58098.1 Protein N-acetyltransferase, RimJ/RimL family [Halobacillus karajensis]